jgi:hypothetical protein
MLEKPSGTEPSGTTRTSWPRDRHISCAGPTQQPGVYRRGSGDSDESATRNRLPPAVDPMRALAHPSATRTPAAAPPPPSARTPYPACMSPRRRGRAVNPVWAAAHPTAAGTPGADPTPLASRAWLPPSILPSRRRSGRIDQGCAGQHRGNQEGGEFAHGIPMHFPAAAPADRCVGRRCPPLLSSSKAAGTPVGPAKGPLRQRPHTALVPDGAIPP